MANHKSAVKRHRQSIQRAARNRAVRTRVKNAVKSVRAAIQNNDQLQAGEALGVASSVLAKAAGKGALHWKKAARKVSRLARAVNAMKAE
ncbi:MULTISPECIES: 30S ribosomal protein S20 [unclassified Desulfovibrio]|uniref:30S ribosomal protein S20 n=1 Tax=unclassified Desulfovibrio TaxID=2593640 RepID=UPI000F5F24BB|nr:MULTISPECIES: 30S ribosomal protein S20 [unclassified Desulfovibrio]RRD69852.1 30S ribosomal protein S20 [Desulfovibrio sp. OH1209_COT-279]RRD86443.1 30S ribosomal protein S20 [Desulfovibrio sp. OH1186_COT-070]